MVTKTKNLKIDNSRVSPEESSDISKNRRQNKFKFRLKEARHNKSSDKKDLKKRSLILKENKPGIITGTIKNMAQEKAVVAKSKCLKQTSTKTHTENKKTVLIVRPKPAVHSPKYVIIKRARRVEKLESGKDTSVISREDKPGKRVIINKSTKTSLPVMERTPTPANVLKKPVESKHADIKPVVKIVRVVKKDSPEKPVEITPGTENPAEAKPVLPANLKSNKTQTDHWSECGLIFYTAGKAYGLTSNLKTICIGTETDLYNYFQNGDTSGFNLAQMDALKRILECRGNDQMGEMAKENMKVDSSPKGKDMTRQMGTLLRAKQPGQHTNSTKKRKPISIR